MYVDKCVFVYVYVSNTQVITDSSGGVTNGLFVPVGAGSLRVNTTGGPPPPPSDG